MTDDTRCSGLTNDGKPCQAPRMQDGEFCLFHSPDPEHKQAAKNARLLGGLHRKVAPNRGEFPGKLETVRDLLTWVNAVAGECWQLETTEKRISTMISLLRVATDIIGLSDLDARLQLLESVIKLEGDYANTIHFKN